MTSILTPEMLAEFNKSYTAPLSKEDHEFLVTSLTLILFGLTSLLVTLVSVTLLHFFRERFPAKNRNVPSRDVDVVVIGGDVVGLMTALFCRKKCPANTSITVVEKDSVLLSSTGESGLSTMYRAMVSLGLPLDFCSHLFCMNSGLSYYHVEDPNFLREITNLDVSFQYDRRVLSMLMLELARRRDIELITGCRSDILQRTDGKDWSVIHNDGFCHVLLEHLDLRKLRMSHLRTKVVVNASGRNGILQGCYRKPFSKHPVVKKHVHFNTNAVWAHFQAPLVKKMRLLKRFDEPTTKHVCFPEGWMWMIRLVDWTKTSDTKLQNHVSTLLDQLEARQKGNTEVKYTCLQRLVEEDPDIQYEYVYSIGFVIRDDMDVSMKSDYDRFMHWVNKYEIVAKAVAPFLGRPTRARPSGRFDVSSRSALGSFNTMPIRDGCLTVGDAAVYGNPFFSRGMNVGIVQAVGAAEAIRDGLMGKSFRFLSAPSIMQRAFKTWFRLVIPLLGCDFVTWHMLMSNRICFAEYLMAYFSASVGDFSLYHQNEQSFEFRNERHAFGVSSLFILLSFQRVIVCMRAAERELASESTALSDGAKRDVTMRCEGQVKEIVRRVLVVSHQGFGPRKFGHYFPGLDHGMRHKGLRFFYELISNLKKSDKKSEMLIQAVQCERCTNWNAHKTTRCASCDARLPDACYQQVLKAGEALFHR